MTPQNILVGVIAVVLAAILAVVNTNWVQPVMSPQLPQVEPLPPSGEEGPGLPAEASIVGATLAKIRSTASKGEMVVSEEPRRVDRNPFLWPGEKPKEPGKAAAETPEGGVVPPEGLEPAEEKPAVVRLILIGEHKKLAVINDTFVFEGSEFEGRTVARIEKEAVILKSEAGETRLTLGEMTYASMRAEKEAAPAAEAEPEALMAAGPAGSIAGQPTQAQQEAVKRLMEKLQPLLGPQQGVAPSLEPRQTEK